MNELRYVGHENQLLTARRITFRGDVSDGVNAIELRNTGGLYATCLEDECLDLFDLSFKGTNLAFQTKNGLVANKFFNAAPGEFGFNWRAGMLYTCGLTNCGGGCEEGGAYHPTHGRIGMTPARNVNICRDENGVTITGTVRDSALFGHQLDLERSLFFPANGKEITIRDTVINREALEAEYMLLYHINMGYPLLTPDSRVIKGKGASINKQGGDVPADWNLCHEPLDVKGEELFSHSNTPDSEGFAYAALINDKLGLGCYVKYSLETLPILIHWKSLRSHDYAMGLEPSNNNIMGRVNERENGTLPKLPGYGREQFQVTIGVLEGAEEIAAFEKMVQAL